jgi:galactokinase/mevalonate kinase-like predicted kinase
MVFAMITTIVRSKAPLRLGLAGGGSDIASYYREFGGYVLNATIDMYTYCTIEPRDAGDADGLVFYAADLNETVNCPPDTSVDAGSKLPLHCGVYNRIVREYPQEKLPAFKMTTYSDAPPGSGLGSSSTMVVAMIKAFVEYFNLPLGEYDIAALAYRVEREDSGLAGGKQDQYAATEKYTIDLQASWMVGDRFRDAGAGKNAGCKTAYIDNGNGGADTGADIVVKNVAEAVAVILKEIQGEGA